MIQGKPMLLQSQFRLTYTMILNLLRVEQLRVEDMMKRSFSEFHTQKDQNKHKEALETLLKEMSNMPEVIDYSGDLEKYYRACEEYTNLRHKLQVRGHWYIIKLVLYQCYLSMTNHIYFLTIWWNINTVERLDLSGKLGKISNFKITIFCFVCLNASVWL